MIIKRKALLRFLIACFIVLLVSVSKQAVSEADGSSAFEDANAKYKAGNFEKAVSLYEDALRNGPATAAVYFNLGNAYFRLHNKGKALAAYERALTAAPRDYDLRWNMAILKSVLQDRIDEVPGANPIVWLGRKVRPFTVDEIAFSLTALLILFLIINLLNFVFSKSRKYTQAAFFIIVAAIVATALLLAVKWLEVKDPWVVVLDKEVNARYGPSEKETSAFLIHEGAKAKVLDESGGWVYIVLSNKDSGWIPKKSCQTI